MWSNLWLVCTKHHWPPCMVSRNITWHWHKRHNWSGNIVKDFRGKIDFFYFYWSTPRNFSRSSNKIILKNVTLKLKLCSTFSVHLINSLLNKCCFSFATLSISLYEKEVCKCGYAKLESSREIVHQGINHSTGTKVCFSCYQTGGNLHHSILSGTVHVSVLTIVCFSCYQTGGNCLSVA